jgi:cytochrome P450
MLRLSSSSVSLGGWPTIPPGTNFAVSAAATNHSEKLENSETFDGFRFARMRSEAGSENRHQLTSTGPDATSFGHGPHACPGRFFASNEIKVILVYLMQTYDMKLKDGEDRPKNLFLPGGAVFPDPNATILVKERIIV